MSNPKTVRTLKFMGRWMLIALLYVGILIMAGIHWVTNRLSPITADCAMYMSMFQMKLKDDNDAVTTEPVAEQGNEV